MKGKTKSSCEGRARRMMDGGMVKPKRMMDGGMVGSGSPVASGMSRMRRNTAVPPGGAMLSRAPKRMMSGGKVGKKAKY